MRYSFKYLLALLIAVTTPAAWAQDEGAEEATKTLDAGFFSRSDSDHADASVSYTVPLTESLDFSTSTSLSNGFNTEDARASRGRNTNLGISYDPPSPWRLNVGYTNSYTLDHRPPSEVYEEFKTETSSNSVDSSLNYEISSDIKTDMTLAVGDSSQEILIEQTKAPPPTSGRNHTFGGGVDYNVTAATTVSVDYNGGIANQKIWLSRTRTFPPRPAKPADSRKIDNTISGSINTNKDLNENLSFMLGFSASDKISRDRLQPALENDALDGSGRGEITYSPNSTLSLSNAVSMGRSKTYYLNKGQYEKEFSERLYDLAGVSFQDNANVRITPSEQSEMNVGFEYFESEDTLRDVDGDLPPPEDLEAANACRILENLTLSSDVNLALGEDITFHLSHYLKESRPQKIVFKEQDSITRWDNLDGNIGFDWTEDLTVNVETSMNIALYRFEDADTALLEDLDDINVRLGTTFIYDVTRDTTLDVKTDIAKLSRIYRDPLSPNGDSARINRHLAATVTRKFGQIFKPQLTLDLTYAREYYPSSPAANRRRLGYSLSPTAEIKTSDRLTLNLDFSYGSEETDAVSSSYYEPQPDDWQIYRTMGGGVRITYVVLNSLTCTFGANNSHAYYIKNSVRRYKEVPEESFFDLDAGLSYTF
jgi:hypothetical protein